MMLADGSNSWVAVDKDNRPVAETWSPKNAMLYSLIGYRVVTSHEWLSELNKRVKSVDASLDGREMPVSSSSREHAGTIRLS